jgi:hypothetical protein
VPSSRWPAVCWPPPPSLSLSGLISWTSSQVTAAAGPGLARALAELSFATGGPGFVVPFALLLAGVCVPALILGLTPRPWAWFGLAAAVAAVLSTFTLLTGTLDVLLPIGRFGGLVWLIGTSVLLPHDRRALRAPGLPDPCREPRRPSSPPRARSSDRRRLPVWATRSDWNPKFYRAPDPPMIT